MEQSKKQLYSIFATMLLLLVAIFAYGTVGYAAPTASAGDIIFNEIMIDPDGVSDADGEWIELVNTTGSDIDIQGWTLIHGSPSFLFSETIASSLVVPATGFTVLCTNSASGSNGGVTTCDYDLTDDNLFANTGVETWTLEDDLNNTIVSIDYDINAGWPDVSTTSGQSVEFSYPDAGTGSDYDTQANAAANWAFNSSSSYGSDGNSGTPGVINTDWNGPTAVTLQQTSTQSAQSTLFWVALAALILTIVSVPLIRRKTASTIQ